MGKRLAKNEALPRDKQKASAVAKAVNKPLLKKAKAAAAKVDAEAKNLCDVHLVLVV
jgi:hypothetical protein